MDNHLTNLYQSLYKERPVDEIKIALLKCFPDLNIVGKYHPLGFYSFSLGNVTDQIALRLHIWASDAKVQDDNLLIHNHTFNFKSLVLHGTIINNTYKVQESQFDDAGELFRVEYMEGSSMLTKLPGRYYLIPETTQVMQMGEYYSVESTEFHESINSSEQFSVTILYTEIVSSDPPLVFSKVSKEDIIEFNRIEMPYTEFELVKMQLAEILRS